MIDAAAFIGECEKLWIKPMPILQKCLVVSEPHFPSSERHYLQKAFLGEFTFVAHIFSHLEHQLQTTR